MSVNRATAPEAPSVATAPAERFTTVAIVLHWIVAAMVLGNVWLGWQLDDAPKHRLSLYFDTHKSIGITVLGLTILRLLWKISVQIPRIGWRVCV